ncbi:hypothetical protein BDN71DRAFT_1436645 [Pleurotus eryngii]|uniref:Uncharacterized protein n=1 Tax=Pleurotus eryngii TaxID=5323 RepID=A0A9P5ZJE7_PLEER|nr:hypothetical protein BDN71DRAFT_1436645 [Pleurotus eryngii]
MGRDIKNSLQRARKELERELANNQDTLGTLAILLAAGHTGGLSNSELEQHIRLVQRCADLAERIMNWKLKDGGIQLQLEKQKAKIREEWAKVEAFEREFQMAARLFRLGDGEGST